MNQQSLFEDDAPAVAGGCSIPEAVLRKPGRAKPTVPPMPECVADQIDRAHGFPAWWRGTAAKELAGVVAEYESHAASEDELFRFVRGSLGVLTGAELAALARWLSNLLRDKT